MPTVKSAVAASIYHRIQSYPEAASPLNSQPWSTAIQAVVYDQKAGHSSLGAGVEEGIAGVRRLADRLGSLKAARSSGDHLGRPDNLRAGHSRCEARRENQQARHNQL